MPSLLSSILFYLGLGFFRDIAHIFIEYSFQYMNKWCNAQTRRSNSLFLLATKIVKAFLSLLRDCTWPRQDVSNLPPQSFPCCLIPKLGLHEDLKLSLTSWGNSAQVSHFSGHVGISTITDIPSFLLDLPEIMPQLCPRCFIVVVPLLVTVLSIKLEIWAFQTSIPPLSNIPSDF